MRHRSTTYLILGLCCCLLVVRLLIAHGGSFETAPTVAWPEPTDIALHSLGPADSSHAVRSFDCTALTYRLLDDITKTMRDGCFIQTAFGMVDPDQSVVIFNNTNEAEPIKLGGQPAAFSILPHSGSVGRFGGFPGAGAYLYLYTDFYSALEGSGNPLFGGRYKSIAQAPNFVVPDTSGQPLAVNPQASAYAARSQWLVTEVPGRAMVRINLATFSVTPFAAAFDPPERALGIHNADMAISEDGRYAAIASAEFKTFKVYDLKNCGAATGSDSLAPQTCRWHDYWPYIEQQVPGSVSRISHLAFVGDDKLQFDVRSTTGSDSYLLKPDGAITSLIPYLGLGDSFASGQGAFNYISGSDTTDNRCHLAARSYPLLLSRDLFGNGGRSVACSGARIHDIGSQSMSYTGQTRQQLSASQQEASGGEVPILHDFLPGYLAQQRFVTSYQPGVITVQVGGNDAGFGDILARCLVPRGGDCFQTYEDRYELGQNIERQYGRLVLLFKQLRAQSPVSRLYAIGYPHIISAQAQCRLNTPLTLPEIILAREITVQLNSVIARAASAAGATYVDINEALHGHELCSGSPGTLAVNGLTAGDDAYGLGQESFHPNAQGHELIEQAILRATHNLSSTASSTPSTGGINTNVPKSGRPVTTSTPGDITGRVLARGGQATVRAPGAELGLKPNADYIVRLGDDPIGSLPSGDDGSVAGIITVPPNAPDGPGVISIGGPGQGDQPVTVWQPVYIPTAPTDGDGDGQPDEYDSCPLTINSGVDSNQNGVDDVCDNADPSPPPIIVVPPPTQPPAEPVVNPPTPEATASPQTLVTVSDLVDVSGDGLLSVASAKPIRALSVSRVSARTSDNLVVAAVLGARLPPVKLPALVSGDWPRMPMLPWWWLAAIVLLCYGVWAGSRHRR